MVKADNCIVSGSIPVKHEYKGYFRLSTGCHAIGVGATPSYIKVCINQYVNDCGEGSGVVNRAYPTT